MWNKRQTAYLDPENAIPLLDMDQQPKPQTSTQFQGYQAPETKQKFSNSLNERCKRELKLSYHQVCNLTKQFDDFCDPVTQVMSQK